MKKFITIIALLISFTGQAQILHCEAWLQKSPDSRIEKRRMIKPHSHDETYTTDIENIWYNVYWDKNLKILYANLITQDGTQAFATVAEPNLQLHNDGFLRLGKNTGLNASISCKID